MMTVVALLCVGIVALSFTVFLAVAWCWDSPDAECWDGWDADADTTTDCRE